MARQPLLARLKAEKPLLADGAMGTLLQERCAVSINACFDQLNLTEPQAVRSVHADYIAAGADMIETNTFGANRFKLGEHGLAHQVEAINAAGVALAREAIQASGRDDLYLIGSVGPLGVKIKPYGSITREGAHAAFAEQISALVHAGADAILLETFPSPEELLIAVRAARAVAPDTPLIAQITFSGDKVTMTGQTPAQVASMLHREGVDVMGVNCGGGPAHIAQMLQMMHHAVPEATFSAMPNAGYPELIGGRVMYPASADYFGEYALTLRDTGAGIMGGCCGTRPEHITAMRRSLDDPANQRVQIQIKETAVESAEGATLPPTQLAQRLMDGQFTINVEMTPPRSFSAEGMLAKARLLRDAGAHCIDVADTPAAKMKMSAWAACHLLHTEVGMETVLHFPTRGRNLLRVQGDLLAAHALGLRNLFVTMGDPTHIGDYPEATNSFDIAPSRLIGLITHDMNDGRDMAGHSIGKPTSFNVGCALNMAADDLAHELKVLRKKLESGADFALGQAVFEPERIEQFLRAYEEREGQPFKMPVLMGVIPLYSLRHASFLHNEVPGIHIPETIFKRLEAAGDNAPREGVRIAQELAAHMRDYVQGVYVIPSYGRYELAAEVVDHIASAAAT